MHSALSDSLLVRSHSTMVHPRMLSASARTHKPAVLQAVVLRKRLDIEGHYSDYIVESLSEHDSFKYSRFVCAGGRREHAWVDHRAMRAYQE